MPTNGIYASNVRKSPAFTATRANDGEDGTISFSEFLNDALSKTNDLLVESQELTNDFAAGKTDNIHQVMIAAEKANIALQFTMQIRNKIMDAYNEIMRMQI
jgi:flagellar hook-basal body complex protein FliE